ncbi:MAG TPA: hypothetical protein DCZ92_06425 [Elusimicrobia bacterium]|nr:MAG: hypothetical protein A2016_06440 [Elusimicrobia bacterium GWF2_62_30]HBA60442.1 hypothetical protein [Elusimicrobiota bacterium]
MLDEESKARSAFYAGLMLFFFVLGGRALQLEPVSSQFFVFSSWTCLLLVSAVLYWVKGSSPLVSRTGEFFVLAFWSAFFGACFELFNLRLRLWQYTSQPFTLSTRWTGHVLSWAVMLPFLFTLTEFLSVYRPFRRIRTPAFRLGKGSARVMYASGAVMLALALALPKFFSPLLCCAFLLPAEALNLRLGLPSLLRELQAGLPEKTLNLLASGTLAGLLWNYWNSLAGAKWAYFVGFNAGTSLAGLPAAGCAAFALFALQSYALCSLASYTRAGKNWEEGTWTMPGERPHHLLPLASYLLVIITLYIALRAVDARSTAVFLGWI